MARTTRTAATAAFTRERHSPTSCGRIRGAVRIVRVDVLSGERRVEEIVRSTGWLMAALDAARDMNPPDWLIGAGAVRAAVWDRLHGFDTATAPADIDVAFFDSSDLTGERERRIEARLRARLPCAPWQAKNQAAVHLWYARKFGYAVEPLTSSADAVATWPETSTAVGLRLTVDDRLHIEAPFGLDDLLGLVHRRNPRRVSVDEYERRLRTKRIAERWPRATILPARTD